MIPHYGYPGRGLSLGTQNTLQCHTTMPTKSKKRALLEELEVCAALELLESDWKDDPLERSLLKQSKMMKLISEDFTEWPSFAELYLYLQGCRQFEQSEPVPKSRALVSLLAHVDDERFRQDVRMTRRAFEHVLGCIAGNPVFANRSDHQQAPVETQLHLALHRFGCNGNGVSIGKVARRFGVSEGTVMNYTDRVVAALLALSRQHIFWYRNDSERHQVKQRIEEKSGFPHCLGAVDGTDIVLAVRPELDGSAYFNRKARYALNAQIVVDDTCRIRHFHLGFPGSVHDARAFGACGLAVRPEGFFRGEEYILADSAYGLTPTVIPSYKGSAANSPENARFNYLHSTVRIATEHAIGQLKGRFGSLRGLRICIRDKATHDKALRWVAACFVLHNMLLDINEDEIGDEFNEDLDTEAAGESDAPSLCTTEDLTASRKREFLKSCVINFNEQA
jgi:hypothetical protein